MKKLLAILLTVVALNLSAQDIYFQFTDLAKWKVVNERPFGPTSTTKRLLAIYYNPATSSPTNFVVRVTPSSQAKISKYLTAEELTLFTAGSTVTLEPALENWIPLPDNH